MDTIFNLNFSLIPHLFHLFVVDIGIGFNSSKTEIMAVFERTGMTLTCHTAGNLYLFLTNSDQKLILRVATVSHS